MMNHYEISSMFSSPESVSEIGLMSKDQLAIRLGGEVSRMHGYCQHNPHHHLDLWGHTLAVISNIDESMFPHNDVQMLRLAALFHDIGKPEVARPKDGRNVFYGHPEKSTEIASRLLSEYGYPDEAIRRICFFIAYHDSFINFKLPEELSSRSNPMLKSITAEEVERQIRHIQDEAATKYGYHPTFDDFSLLMHLVMADAAAQAEVAYLHGKVRDTRQNKLRRAEHISALIDEIHSKP